MHTTTTTCTRQLRAHLNCVHVTTTCTQQLRALLGLSCPTALFAFNLDDPSDSRTLNTLRDREGRHMMRERERASGGRGLHMIVNLSILLRRRRRMSAVAPHPPGRQLVCCDNGTDERAPSPDKNTHANATRTHVSSRLQRRAPSHTTPAFTRDQQADTKPHHAAQHSTTQHRLSNATQSYTTRHEPT